MQLREQRAQHTASTSGTAGGTCTAAVVEGLSAAERLSRGLCRAKDDETDERLQNGSSEGLDDAWVQKSATACAWGVNRICWGLERAWVKGWRTAWVPARQVVAL